VIPPEAQPLTLGDLLYTGNGQTLIFEHTWVDLVRSIAARDQLALHELYTRTYGVVFTRKSSAIGKWPKT
jgi:RNA polymerase sigma-70 factor, ECF subfamily